MPRRGLNRFDELRNNGVVKYASEEQEGPAVEQTDGLTASAPEKTEQRGSATHAAAPHDEQQGTRNRVARSILDHGPSTAAELALRLELTQAAVRRHLDALAAEGVVEPREKRVYGTRGRGRPAKAFALTDCGRDAFDQAYDQLASEALRWIAQSGAGGGEKGEAAVAAFARARLAAQAEGYREAVEAAEPHGPYRGPCEGVDRGRVRCYGAQRPQSPAR